MALNLSMSQGLHQTLSMQLTPSQRLSLEILQLNVQNLEARIQEEIEANPLLEIKDEADDPAPGDEARTVELSSDLPADSVSERQDEVDDIREELEPVWSESDYQGPSARTGHGEDEEDMLGSVPARSRNLEEDLREQVEFLKPPEDLKEYIFYIISHLDDKGYLSLTLDELARREQDREPLDRAMLEKALLFVRERLDPPGLGAHNLKECLLLQIRRFGPGFELEQGILDRHFEDILNNRLDVIATAEKVSIAQVKEAFDLYRSLEFRPAEAYGETVSMPLRPDAIVIYEPPEKEGEKGRFIIRLAKKGIPELVVTPGTVYKNAPLSREEKHYLIEKAQAGRSLIEAIRRRNETLLLVVQDICQRQMQFFEEGRGGLKPLLRQEIARDVGLSPATVTRTVKDKVVQTDFGIFPLSFFFSLKKVTSSEGDEMERPDVLAALEAAVLEEDKDKPLSDAALGRRLAQKGFRIATRTVSKYRELLNIPSSSKRKVY